MELEFKTMPLPRVVIFNPDNASIGVCNNQFELVEVLKQIKKKSLTGYTYGIRGSKLRYPISSTGGLQRNPFYVLYRF